MLKTILQKLNKPLSVPEIWFPESEPRLTKFSRPVYWLTPTLIVIALE